MSICGTRPGYQRHQDEATRPCSPCLSANSDAVKASRIRRGRQRSVNITVDVLRRTLEAHDCAALLDFLGETVAEAVKHSPKA